MAVSSATPQQAADNLVAAALTAGGADNVTVVVIDVLNDGLADAARKRLFRGAAVTGIIVAAAASSLPPRSCAPSGTSAVNDDGGLYRHQRQIL